LLKTRDFKSLSLHIDAHSAAANPLFSYSSQKRVGVFSKSVRSRDFRSDAQAFVGAACDIPRHKSQGEVGMPGRGSRAQACLPPGRPGLYMGEVVARRGRKTKRVARILRGKRWGLSTCIGAGTPIFPAAAASRRRRDPSLRSEMFTSEMLPGSRRDHIRGSASVSGIMMNCALGEVAFRGGSQRADCRTNVSPGFRR